MAIINSSESESPQPRGEAFAKVVLDVTLVQLAEVGFERLSIPEIAAIAGVNKTSIYRRWINKAGLVQDALRAAMIHTEQAPDTGNLRGDLVELARTVAAFTQSRVGTAIIRIMLAQEGNSDIHHLANMAYAEAGKSGPWLTIKRATERGELNADVDPSLVLFTLAGAIMHRVFVERKDASDAFIKQVVDLVLFGATTKR
jgi:AcrR family transcriptional regulator